MSSVGPELPPHLAPKRKREDEDDSDQDFKVPAAHPRSRSRSSSNEADKRRRIIGPAPPPAPLDERPPLSPTSRPKDNDDDSGDDFGPAPPPPIGSATHAADLQRVREFEAKAAKEEATKNPAREDWMLAPPSQGDWTSRVDPTKLKNRKFNTGKGAKAPAQGGSKDSTLWTETPEQKRKRLEDEVMGVKGPATVADPGVQRSARSEAEARETERRIQEYNEKNRNSSLYTEHKKTNPHEKEDDPSKRGFDREKDIAGGMKIGTAKRRELLAKSKDFGSRFEKGRYL